VIPIPSDDQHADEIVARETARRKLDQLKEILSGLNDPLQEAVAIVANLRIRRSSLSMHVDVCSEPIRGRGV
jgi:hypothetical protein